MNQKGYENNLVFCISSHMWVFKIFEMHLNLETAAYEYALYNRVPSCALNILAPGGEAPTGLWIRGRQSQNHSRTDEETERRWCGNVCVYFLCLVCSPIAFVAVPLQNRCMLTLERRQSEKTKPFVFWKWVNFLEVACLYYPCMRILTYTNAITYITIKVTPLK